MTRLSVRLNRLRISGVLTKQQCRIEQPLHSSCLNDLPWLLKEAEEDRSCNLRDLQEGLVGRVLVRKSGRVQLLLGNVTLDVDLGTTSSFLQVSNKTINASLHLLALFMNFFAKVNGLGGVSKIR